MYLLAADNPMLISRALGRIFFEADTGANGGGGGEPTPVPAADTNPTPAQSEPSQGQSLVDFLNDRMAGKPVPDVPPGAPIDGGSPKPDATPKPNEGTPVNIPDKFKNEDGSVNVEAMAKSYVNMESMYSKQAPQLKELQDTVSTLQQQIAAQAQAANAQKPQDQQLSEDELRDQAEALNEKFWEDYNENPRQAIADLIKEVMSPDLKPILDERQAQAQAKQEAQAHQARVDAWAVQVKESRSQHADFEQMLPKMKEVIDKYGDILTSREDAVEMAYNLAKSGQAMTVDQLLSDPNAVAQLVQNPEVRKIVLSQHMTDIKNNTPPPVISSGTGLPPSSTPVNLTNMKEAKEAFAAKYRGFNIV